MRRQDRRWVGVLTNDESLTTQHFAYHSHDLSSIRTYRRLLTCFAGQVLDLASAGVELALAGNECDRKTAAIGVFELLPELLGFRIDFHRQAGRTELRRE